MKTCNGYTGSTERINYIIGELTKVLPGINRQALTCDGGRAWGKNIYISDCLFTVRVYTPDGAYEFDHIHGLKEYTPNYFYKQLTDAQDALQGENNHFTIEQARSFLKYNKN